MTKALKEGSAIEMQTKVYIADVGKIDLVRVNELSAERAERVSRLKKIGDKKRCIAGGLLIKKLLPGVAAARNKFGKPVDKNGAFFNLSHSGNYAILASSDFEIGCDIQKIEYINSAKTGKIVFCKNEMQLLRNSRDKLGTFYDLWTKKESFLKCIGEGFHRSPKSADVSRDFFEENGEIYYFKTYRFSDYVISLCSLTNDFPKTIEFIDL